MYFLFQLMMWMRTAILSFTRIFYVYLLAVTSSSRSSIIHVSISRVFSLPLSLFFYFLLRYRYVYLFIRTNKIIENVNETNERKNKNKCAEQTAEDWSPIDFEWLCTLKSSQNEMCFASCLDNTPFRCA